LTQVVYLGAIYWAIVPFLIGSVLGSLDFNGNIDTLQLFPFYIFTQLNIGIFALWAMLSYLYFSVEKKSVSTTVTGNDNNRKHNNATEIPLENRMNTDTTSIGLKTSYDFIFTSQEIVSTETPTLVTTSAPPAPAIATEALAQQPKYVFNIFDGTDASGAFAEFIYDVDSDYEEEENAITDHWAAVQDHT